MMKFSKEPTSRRDEMAVHFVLRHNKRSCFFFAGTSTRVRGRWGQALTRWRTPFTTQTNQHLNSRSSSETLQLARHISHEIVESIFFLNNSLPRARRCRNMRGNRMTISMRALRGSIALRRLPQAQHEEHLSTRPSKIWAHFSSRMPVS